MTDVLEPATIPHETHLEPAHGAGHGDAHGSGHAGGHDEHHGPTGILNWLTSTDHKVIGLSYTVTSVCMLVVGGAFAEIIRLQLLAPTNHFVNLAQYNELFTMHGSVMIYLFAGPFAFGALANYIVPIQIGAPDMAFPRLNALSYWLYLSGCITMLLGFFTAGGAANFGWVGYAPLSNSINSPGLGCGPVDRGPAAHGLFCDLHRCQLDGHHLLPSRAGHDPVPHADFHLEPAGHRHLDPARVPGPHRGTDHAVLRPPLWDPYL